MLQNNDNMLQNNDNMLQNNDNMLQNNDNMLQHEAAEKRSIGSCYNNKSVCVC